MAHNSRLEDEVFAKEDAIKRLNDVNSSLSARTLTLAEDAENDKRALSTRLQSQIDVLKKQTEEATQAAAKAKQDAEAERGAGSLQMMQLMDELNSLQEEVQNLRTKLRAKGG
jgi:DNA anti-recombination protein RmuC